MSTVTDTPFVIPIKGHLIHSNRREFKQRVLDELERGRKAIIVDDDVQTLFAITKLDEAIPIADTVGAAIARIGGGA